MRLPLRGIPLTLGRNRFPRLMLSSTVENYLKEIYLAAEQASAERVPMGELARAVGVVPGTATTMVKSLSANGFIDYKPRVGVRLTALGEQVAVGILRRHRLVEYFLVESLGLSWDAIHDEAERLEHAISERVLDALDQFLGHPATDPHGDPIPSAQGVVSGHATRPLSSCSQGSHTVIVRILDQEAGFLRFADESGLRPGARIEITRLSSEADAITVRTAGSKTPLSMSLLAADKILVKQ